MARMPGRYARAWCPYCRRSAGPDCTTRTASKRQIRYKLKRELARWEEDDDGTW